MSSGNEQNHWILGRFLDSLRRHGPLGTAKRVNTAMSRHFGGVPGCRYISLSIDTGLNAIQRYLDGSIDRKFGTDTSGYIPLDRLTIESNNAKDGVWYEPMSAKIFSQIMENLDIKFHDFEFVDLGSGKGRVLFMASNYKFKKIIGVEFSKELDQIAQSNIALWRRQDCMQGDIMTICMDATEYAIPSGSLVIFLYSPFMGKTMAQVIKNISTSFSGNPREIVLVFYGTNPETIGLLKQTRFHWKEVSLHSDWSQFNKYRAFVFSALPHDRGRRRLSPACWRPGNVKVAAPRAWIGMGPRLRVDGGLPRRKRRGRRARAGNASRFR